MQFNTFCDWKLLILLNKHNLELNLSRTRKNQIKKENLELSNVLLYQNSSNSNLNNYIQSRLRFLSMNDLYSGYHSIFKDKFLKTMLMRYNLFLFNFLHNYNYYCKFFTYSNNFTLGLAHTMPTFIKNFNMSNINNKELSPLNSLYPSFSNVSFIIVYRALFDIQNFLFFYKSRIFKFLNVKNTGFLFDNHYFLSNFLNILVFIFFVGFLFEEVHSTSVKKPIKSRILFKNRWKYLLKSPKILSLKNKNS